MKNNLELKHGFAKLSNGQNNSIVQAESANREAELQLLEKDREIADLKNRIVMIETNKNGQNLDLKDDL